MVGTLAAILAPRKTQLVPGSLLATPAPALWPLLCLAAQPAEQPRKIATCPASRAEAPTLV